MDENKTIGAPRLSQALWRIGGVWALVFGPFIGAALAMHLYGLAAVDRILENNPRLLYDEALTLFGQQRDFQGALKIIEEALAKSPNNHRMHFLACDCYTELGELGKAMEHVNQAIKNSPSDHPDRWRYFLRRGDLTGRVQGAAAAIPDWEQSLELNKNSADLYFKLAEAYAGKEDYGRARAYLDQAIALDVNNVDYLYLAGVYWMKEHNSVEAAKLFERVLRLQPDHPDALYNMFRCEQQSGRLMKAEEHLVHYLELRPDDANAKRELTRLRGFLRK